MFWLFLKSCVPWKPSVPPFIHLGTMGHSSLHLFTSCLYGAATAPPAHSQEYEKSFPGNPGNWESSTSRVQRGLDLFIYTYFYFSIYIYKHIYLYILIYVYILIYKSLGAGRSSLVRGEFCLGICGSEGFVLMAGSAQALSSHPMGKRKAFCKAFLGMVCPEVREEVGTSNAQPKV